MEIKSNQIYFDNTNKSKIKKRMKMKKNNSKMYEKEQ